MPNGTSRPEDKSDSRPPSSAGGTSPAGRASAGQDAGKKHLPPAPRWSSPGRSRQQVPSGEGILLEKRDKTKQRETPVRLEKRDKKPEEINEIANLEKREKMPEDLKALALEESKAERAQPGAGKVSLSPEPSPSPPRASTRRPLSLGERLSASAKRKLCKHSAEPLGPKGKTKRGPSPPTAPRPLSSDPGFHWPGRGRSINEASKPETGRISIFIIARVDSEVQVP